ncbi:PAS domain-containing sensor histidine kinase [Bacteriovorax sp. PP10]|uniref:histidine kinase n=1 Tax=Bacteriovorax antarcticus TaxID=3088717 RepID=A0ABU5VTA1_9BACT|nr:PAS domain-containing sensor histidine kinase [Bacteriovorax sp. PP10]MEA9356221.1 PAS domain-containing sensor histidine kinase [Bacteriovorax sp. PP10]
MDSEANALELRDFFLQAPMPFAVLNGPDHQFTFANSAYEKFVERAVVGKTIKDLFAYDEVKDYLPLLDKVYATGISFIGNEMPFFIKDGLDANKRLWINVAYHAFREACGKIKGIIVFITDVTDIVNAKHTIQKSENQFRLLSNALPNMVWMANPDGKIDWYSDVWYKYTGHKKNSISNEISLVIHPDDILLSTEKWNKAIKKQVSFKKEIRLKKFSTGEYRWHLCLGIPVKDENGIILRWIGSYTDIHDQKINVQNLEQERDLKEVFVSTLSHDLRTPLTVAKLSAQMIAKVLLDEPALLKSAKRISSNMDRADKMIQDLLDTSLIKAGGKLPLKIKECSLNALLKAIIEDLSSVYGDRFKINSTEQINGFWDPVGLRRVFENILMNAVKYGRDEGPIKVTANCLNQNVEIKIHNEGDQINPNELSLLFTRFKRTEDSHSGHQKGWGLGLTLVKGLTEAHGGSIHAISLKDGGTTFTVSLPLDSQKYGLRYDEKNG